MRRVTALLVLGLASGLRAQTPAPVDAIPAATVALVETDTNGRTAYELVTARPGKMWTSRFPRVEGYVPPAGLPRIFAVQIARVLEGGDIRARVSVLLGSANGDEVTIADALITPTSHVVVDGLKKFGFQPITLSMASVAPFTPYPPTVVSVTPLIEIASVEILTAPYPGYRVTLRNLSDKAAANAYVQSYRGEEKASSTLRRNEAGRALMTPGATHTFDLNLTSGGASQITPPGTWTPQPIDVIEIEAIRGEDGTHDGVPKFPGIEPAIASDSGRRVQLQRIVAILRDASPSLPVLRARIGALPDAEPDQLAEAQAAMRMTKAAILADIKRFEDSPTSRDSSNSTKWLAATLARYELWLKRVSP